MKIEQKSTPLLAFMDIGKAIRWYERAYFAIEQYRVISPSGVVAHVQLEMLGFRVNLAEADWEDVRRRFRGGSSKPLAAVVEDAGGIYHRAVLSGAIVNQRLRLGCDGCRSAVLEDPFGHRWRVAERAPWLRDESLTWVDGEAM